MMIKEARLYIQQGEPATRSACTGGFTEKVPPGLSGLFTRNTHFRRLQPEEIIEFKDNTLRPTYTCTLRLVTGDDLDAHVLMASGFQRDELEWEARDFKARIAPMLIGVDAFDREFIWQRLWYGQRFLYTGRQLLDTVDGKLARCTITSSKWGNVIDHGVDLVHPPFWWYFWGTGLAYWGLQLPGTTFAFVMTAVVAGYVLQRLIEGMFLKDFKMDIHVWRRFDSQFRLITARRNPNMVILFVALLAGRPDIGLVALAWWTIISLIVHAVRLAQAYAMRASGRPVVSWMDEAEAALEGQHA